MLNQGPFFYGEWTLKYIKRIIYGVSIEMIELSNVSKRYENKYVTTEVLDNINIKINDNSIVAITGASGSGKTTLLNAIAGLVKFSGNVEINGKISYLFQEDRLLNWLTAKENIMIVEPSDEKVKRYSNLFGVNEYVDEMPQNLSGGMKRRVALVRTLAYDADIYLLDEPFKGLDESNVEKVYEAIKEISENKLVLVVTHNEQDAVKLNAKKISL